ncbi:MAG: hypothetical protein QXV69_06510 [Sulfolobaceae archaeon]
MPKRCLRCGYVYEDESINECSKCGYTIFQNISKDSKSAERRIFLGLLGLLIGLFIISLFLPIYQNSENSQVPPSVVISATEVSSIISGNWILLVNQTGSFYMYPNGTAKLNLLNGSMVTTTKIASKLILYPGIIISSGNGIIESLFSSASNSSITIIILIPENSSYINTILNQFNILVLLNKFNKISNYTYYDSASNTVLGVIANKNMLILVNGSGKLSFNDLYQVFSYIRGKLLY